MAPICEHLLSDNSTVSNDQLHVGGISVSDLVAEYGSPLFIYDEDHIRARCAEAVEVFGPHATYASKAFSCRYMAKLVTDCGMGIDVATGGELEIALAAGIDPVRVTFHGNNKSLEELSHAIGVGVGKIVIDSFDELERLEYLHSQNLSAVPNVLIRVTPGIKAETHKYNATGHDDSKFGLTVSTGDAKVCIDKALASPAVNVLGIHAHIGSQVFVIESFVKAFRVIAEIAEPYDFSELVIGGGIGVAYVEGETTPSITEWAAAIRDEAERLGVKASVGIEPGRSIVAAAATTVYTVGTIKKIPGVRNYVAVDGGMSDNPRPAMYGSKYETFCPLNMSDERTMTANLVGKHCESGDVIVEDAQLPGSLSIGDLVATPVTGAYGLSLSSNYNGVPRPAVVFVSNGEVKLVKRRETIEDLLATDIF